MRPPFLEIDFETMRLEVCRLQWTTLAPASWCWPAEAKATERTSPRSPGSIMKIAGVFHRQPAAQVGVHLFDQ